MKTFFQRFAWRSGVILLLFLGMNFLFVLVSIHMIKNHSIDTEGDIGFLSAGIEQQGEQVVLSEQARLLLEERELWAMLLDEDGNIVWEYHLPDKLKQKYSVSQVAAFSRWYLEDYPVLVDVREEGLLVVGYPPEGTIGITLTKLYYVTDSGVITSVAVGTLLLLGGNLCVMLLFYIRLRQTSQARADWMNGVSHDIRTPLSLIMGYASQMEEDGGIPGYVRKDARLIRLQSERVRELITDLNLVSRMEYSMQPIKKEKVNLREVVRECIIYYYETAGEKYKIIPEIGEDGDCTISGDEALLRRMMMNLIHNSILHNEAGCEIRIGIQSEEKKMAVWVQDDGKGVDDRQLEKLNSLWLRQEQYGENGEAAHGVGMKLVKEIVAAHRGKISFQRGEKKGLKVRILF